MIRWVYCVFNYKDWKHWFNMLYPVHLILFFLSERVKKTVDEAAGDVILHSTKAFEWGLKRSSNEASKSSSVHEIDEDVP